MACLARLGPLWHQCHQLGVLFSAWGVQHHPQGRPNDDRSAPGRAPRLGWTTRCAAAAWPSDLLPGAPAFRRCWRGGLRLWPPRLRTGRLGLVVRRRAPGRPAADGELRVLSCGWRSNCWGSASSPVPGLVTHQAFFFSNLHFMESSCKVTSCRFTGVLAKLSPESHGCDFRPWLLGKQVNHFGVQQMLQWFQQVCWYPVYTTGWGFVQTQRRSIWNYRHAPWGCECNGSTSSQPTERKTWHLPSTVKQRNLRQSFGKLAFLICLVLPQYVNKTLYPG